MTVVLDAWAVMAMLRGEPSARRVRSLVLDEEPAMCSVNLGEVLYALIRIAGPEIAVDRVEGVRQVVEMVDPDWSLVEAAARIKARGRLSYADAFCLATGQAREAPVATGDPELLGCAGPVELIDLRAGR